MGNYNHPSHDPGFGEKYSRPTKRIINKDGSFNVIRRGNRFYAKDVYLYLLNASWLKFLTLLILFYLVINLAFTLCYLAFGIEYLEGGKGETPMHSFLNAYFFSVQTFTTVGYGGIVPKGVPANILASIEAMSGWLFFAIATGLMYGRFSRPSSRILFSNQAIITPPDPVHKLMFRIVNERNDNMLMEMEAKVLIMFVDRSQGGHNRKYFNLKLEVKAINFFPMNWTLVHPIDEESPLHGRSRQELEGLEAEILILLKGFDDAFSQIILTRYSYRYDEIVWGARFKRAYDIDENGEIIMEMGDIHKFDRAPIGEKLKT